MRYFAHRGLSDYVPENTMSAFEEAVKEGATAIELDVQLTRDGEIIVLHDFILGRTNDGDGLVKDMKWTELSKLDAGSWFDKRFMGLRIPNLEEVLAELPQNIFLNIEMKRMATDSNKGFAAKLVELLKKYKREVLVSSFDHALLKEVQALDESIPLGLLYSSNLINPWEYAEANGLKLAAIHPSIEYVSKKLVDQAHQQGLSVNVYTIKTAQQATLLSRMGVDGIFINNFDFVEVK